ncbi:crossover junction endodeoxyribonuclease RuvC [Sporosarcina sp. ACRSL]|uniref:crossover junction endodeoxyribonuclease RuvC n=1 Tax=Sporosarcina sp. ACRSL TaxID=2918215 RepID=UPI001EF74F2A|nr:crossover junction endodeoxyribonuclease RuvC [Sporosarcina sp. ACRSL]MCG7345345.1 crossover junction endodeoxyribonuclease RuvC [Sporosarcina sp. ACRSL]
MTAQKNLRILALDISTSPGFAVLEVKTLKAGPRVKLLHVDHVKTDSNTPDSQRYAYIEAKTVQVVHEYGPFDVVCREHFTKGRSKRATQLVFGAWAAVDSALGRYNYAISEDNEFTPSAVKKAASRNGSADKEDVEKGVRTLLKLPEDFVFTTDDESDAVAVGIAYLKSKGLIV